MSQLTDAGKIETYLGISAALAAKVARRLRMAEIYLRNLKGDTWYDDLLALQGTDPADQDVLDAEEAESLIAFNLALPHVNLRVDEDGGVLVQEWTDIGLGGRLQKTFAGGKRLEEVRGDLLFQAKMLIGGDVVVEYDTDDGEEAEGAVITGVLVSPSSGVSLSTVPVE